MTLIDLFLFKHHLFTEDLQRHKALKYLLTFTQSRGKKAKYIHTNIRTRYF